MHTNERGIRATLWHNEYSVLKVCSHLLFRLKISSHLFPTAHSYRVKINAESFFLCFPLSMSLLAKYLFLWSVWTDPGGYFPEICVFPVSMHTHCCELTWCNTIYRRSASPERNRRQSRSPVGRRRSSSPRRRSRRSSSPRNRSRRSSSPRNRSRRSSSPRNRPRRSPVQRNRSISPRSRSRRSRSRSRSRSPRDRTRRDSSPRDRRRRSSRDSRDRDRRNRRLSDRRSPSPQRGRRDRCVTDVYPLGYKQKYQAGHPIRQKEFISHQGNFVI